MHPTFEYCLRAERLVRTILLELRPRLLEARGHIEHARKADDTVVTELDILVEEQLRNQLAELDPDIGFCGEETGGVNTQKTFWLVDPIDGTEAFIRGLPFCTNMLALVDNDQVVMSIIYNFTLDEFYVAIKDHGSTCNGHKIHVSSRPIKHSYVSLYGNVGKAFPGTGDKLRNLVRGMPKSHASGCDYAWVARGALDGVVLWYGSGQAHLWDHAAGPLLIAEAGGRVSNIGSDTYDFRNTNLIAANPVIFDELKSFIQTSNIS